jgi:hypothetical protein
MTQEDKDELEKRQKALKNQFAFESERGEAETWEDIKDFYLPETHSKIEKIVRDRYDGDVEKFSKDWITIVGELIDEE